MTPSFILAVDVGTSRTAAATARIAPDGSVVAAAFALGRHGDSAPSVVFVGDGDVLFGDAAERRGITQPERLVREVKRRIGDDVPIIAGDRRFSAEQLYARMIAWVIETVAEREGRQPAAISVAVPVTWGRYRLDRVSAALAREGWGEVDLITEPAAAFRHYEAEHPMTTGAVIGVYDLGGGTFDAAIMRKSSVGSVAELVGEPVGLDAFGGADFDDLVLGHTLAAAGLSVSAMSVGPSARVAQAALRRECVDAKESLSFDSEAVVPVLLGEGVRTVRLIRSEFESMIEFGIARTISVFAECLAAADVGADELDAILLTGGSSRIPRIAQLLSEQFDRPIAVDADPKAIIALGAARAAADAHLRTVASAAPEQAAPDDDDASTEAVRAAPFARRPTLPRPRSGRGRKIGVGPAVGLAGGALILALGVVATTGFPFAAAGSAPAGNEIAPSTTISTPAVKSASTVSTLLSDYLPVGGMPRGGSAPTVEDSPLLIPAPSDRIQNNDAVPVTDTTSTSPSPIDQSAAG